jgi:hypothetical protein
MRTTLVNEIRQAGAIYTSAHKPFILEFSQQKHRARSLHGRKTNDRIAP